VYGYLPLTVNKKESKNCEIKSQSFNSFQV